jgi:hypothetical protein
VKKKKKKKEDKNFDSPEAAHITVRHLLYMIFTGRLSIRRVN